MWKTATICQEIEWSQIYFYLFWNCEVFLTSGLIMVLCQLWLALMLAAAPSTFVRPWLISNPLHIYLCRGLRVAGPVRVNSCIVCGERVLAVVQRGGSLIEAASESLDWSASLRPGSHLHANICAAEIHPFDSFLFPFGMIQPIPLLIPNMRWFAWLLCRWYRNLNSIVWAYVEWLGSPGLFILRCEVYILPFLSALCLLFRSWLPSLFFILSVR